MAQATPAKDLRAYVYKRFDGYGMEAPLSKLKEHLWGAERVQLFTEHKIAKLEIRFSELWHRCTDDEWREFKVFLSEQGVPIVPPPWWAFWRR